MTISSTTTKITYNGNGSTDTFPYTFKILDDDDIIVEKRITATGVITTLVKTTDYTVSGVGEEAGGNVTLVDPATDAPSGSQITIRRNMTILQETDYEEYDTFPASTHESALDRLTMIAQQLSEAVDRAIKLDSSLTGISNQIEGTPSAGDVIQFNADEDGWQFTSMSDIDGYGFPAGTGVLVQTAAGMSVTRTNTGTANEITVTNGSGVSGNPTYSLPTALTFTGKTVTGGTFSGVDIAGSTTLSATFTMSGAFTNAGGVKILDSDSSHKLTITTGSNLTADRTLNINTGDNARTLDISGANVTISAFMATVLDDAAASNARTTLDAEQTISGRAMTAVTVATDDKIIIQDTSDSNNEKTVTAQSVADLLGAASDTAQGKIEIAVQSEMETGTDTTRAVVPGRQQYHPSAAKFWVEISAGTTNILAGYNVASITRTAAGDYTINYTTAFSGTSYVVFVMAYTTSNLLHSRVQNLSTTSCRVQLYGADHSTLTDPSNAIMVMGFGDQ